MPSQVVLRWIAIGVFMLTPALNFLDRQLVAALAPTLKREFQLSNTQYGGLVSAFFVFYSISAPFAGLFVDSVGLNAGASIAVIVWSLACASAGLAQSLPVLMACRMALGLGEAGGVPASAKAGAMYLAPEELALQGAMGAAGIAVGSTGAPLLVEAIEPRYGWRSVFLFCGLLGLLWVPLWWYTSRRIPPPARGHKSTEAPAWALLRSRQLWSVALAFGLGLAFYSLWQSWTTVYLVQERHMTQSDANRYFAWIPPLFGFLGTLSSGVLTFRWIRKGMGVLPARLLASWLAVPLLLVGAAVPFLPSTPLAVAAIAASLLGFQSILNNIVVMPLDLFGARRAAFSTSVMLSTGAAAQALVSPLIGVLVDRYGFTAVCVGAPLLPLLGIWILQLSLGAKRSQGSGSPPRLSPSP